MHQYPSRRDKNEKPIIAALRAVGASVQQLNETGCPDLLVGIGGKMFLIEVKQEHGKAEAHGKKTESGLRPSQEKWWAEWKGPTPVIATTSTEALKAIGVELLV